MTVVFVFLGLLNGVCIALSRILNGQLSLSMGPFRASFVNHLIGFAFLSLFMTALWSPPQFSSPSVVVYGGGVIGAFYVAINSLVMTKLGSTNAIILVIGGQMLFSLVLDAREWDQLDLVLNITGVGLIVVGILCKEMIRSRKSTNLTKSDQKLGS